MPSSPEGSLSKLSHDEEKGHANAPHSAKAARVTEVDDGVRREGGIFGKVRRRRPRS